MFCKRNTLIPTITETIYVYLFRSFYFRSSIYIPLLLLLNFEFFLTVVNKDKILQYLDNRMILFQSLCMVRKCKKKKKYWNVLVSDSTKFCNFLWLCVIMSYYVFIVSKNRWTQKFRPFYNFYDYICKNWWIYLL